MDASMRVALIAVLLTVPGLGTVAQEPPPSPAPSTAPGPAPETLAVGQPSAAASPKSPWVAGGLAYLFPGAGHFYVGEPRRAWTIIGLVGLGANLFLNDGGPRDLALSGGVLALGTYAASVVDAPLAARRYNRRLEAARRAVGQAPEERHAPSLADSLAGASPPAQAAVPARGTWLPGPGAAPAPPNYALQPPGPTGIRLRARHQVLTSLAARAGHPDRPAAER